ncbi:MAG: terminase small subunit [Lachnospiraceae bacterium]|nr:terminase small subunit [Lachnospiraceae bacterium]
MPRKPDEKIEQARDLYLNGSKLIEIANDLGIPEGTVRSWKNRYKWDGDSNATLQKNKCNVAIEKKKKSKAVEEVTDEVLENSGLTAKQQLFCIYYVNSYNATTSYQKAYECKRETAMVNGSKMLRNTKVREEIEKLKKEKCEYVLFDKEDIFQWHLNIATASITDFVSFGREKVQLTNMFGPVVDKETKEPVMKEVNYVKFKESDDVDGRLIKKVKMGKDGASIELYDAYKSMEWLSRNMDSGTERQQSIASQIIEAYGKRKDGEPDDG